MTTPEKVIRSKWQKCDLFSEHLGMHVQLTYNNWWCANLSELYSKLFVISWIRFYTPLVSASVTQLMHLTFTGQYKPCAGCNDHITAE